MLRHGLSDRTRIDVDARSLEDLARRTPNIDVMISSQYSPLLADGLSKGKIGAAFFDGNKGARLGVPPSRQGTLGGDLA